MLNHMLVWKASFARPRNEARSQTSFLAGHSAAELAAFERLMEKRRQAATSARRG